MDVEEIIDSESTKSQSALHENISRKGSSSYYYAHGNTANGPKWDGKEEPRLLERTVSDSAPVKQVAIVTFDYAWADEKANVRIYIDFDNASTVEDSDIALDHTENSFNFIVNANNKRYQLSIASLNNDISKASFKKKSSSFVITLKKELTGSWYSLKKST